MNPPDVDRLVIENQPLVAYFANRWQLPARIAQLDWDDLISAGKIGLAEAAKRYDPAKGKFSTYAKFWIEKQFRKALKEQRAGAGVFTVSLETVVHEDERGGITLEDVTPDKNAPDAPSLLSAQETPEKTRQLMVDAGLDDRERKIISQRWGLDDGEPKTQKQIANGLALTRARIGQLEKVARTKIEAYSRKKNCV